MSRIIKTETAGKSRSQLSKGIVIALRELMKQTSVDILSEDLVAFIVIALREIHGTVDTSVEAWEKRGYWVKADRFRLEWEWTGGLGDQLQISLLNDNWAEIARISALIGQKMMGVEVSQHHRLGTPWVGAYQHLVNQR